MSKVLLLSTMLSLILFVSCKKQPSTAEDFSDLPARINFDFIKAKSKIEYQEGAQKNKATLNLRVQKDSAIWASIMSTIEGFRILITPDSIQMIDRLNKRYTALSYSDLKDKMGFDLNYVFFENLITAEVPQYVLEEGKRIKQNDMTYVLYKKGYFQFEYFVTSSMKRLEKVTVTEMPTQNKLTIDYKNFVVGDNFEYPQEMILNLKYVQNQKLLQTDILIDHNSFELLPASEDLKLPFNIPDRYERN